MYRIVFAAFVLALALLQTPSSQAQDTETPLAPSISDIEVRALIAAAQDIDMEQAPAAAQAGWQAAYDAAQELDGVVETDRAALLNQLGSAIFYAGGREEALASFQEASDIFEQAGPDHLEALEQSLGNVATILGALGRLDDAEAAHRRVLDIRRELYPENHVQMARSYFELGVILNARGDIDGAIALVERSLEIRAAVLEDGHPHIAMTQVSLAAILIRAYRHEDAAGLTRSAAEQLEANLPPGHPFIGFARSSYAGALNAWGRYEAAEPLLRTTLSARRESLGDAHPQVADTLNNLGSALYGQGRASEARPLFLAARDIYRNAAGDASVEAARVQMNAADAALAEGDFETARAEWLEALNVLETAGTTGPDRLRVLTELASVEALSGNTQQGFHHLGEARVLAASYLPDGHERRHELAIDEAWISAISGDAMRFVPPEIDAAVAALASDLRLVDVDEARDMARRRGRAFRRALDVAFAASDTDAALRYMQHVHATGLALAAEANALRARAQGLDAASLIRARQDGWRALRRAEDNYVRVRSAGTEPDPQALAEARNAYSQARSVLEAIPGAEDPANTASTVSADALQAALTPGQSVIAFAFTEGGGVALGITHDRVIMDRLAISQEGAQANVTALRSSLEAGLAASAIQSFPAAAARALYAGVFTPRLTGGLETEEQLLVLADGPYRSIPFPVLLTAEYTTPMSGDAAFRGAPWLIRNHAVATLASFADLTGRPAHRVPREPYLIGFGAPVFDGEAQADTITLAAVSRNAGADGMRALSSLAPLPGARAELQELAGVFGPQRADIRLGLWATETAVKSADLARASMLVFATHGLLSGELETVFEPALAFTPPDEPDGLDDGLLTASEIAALQLDADWVVLSACNTFASDGTARAPDRLAQAFLYAGARSLLVSHWAVRDDAAASITAETARRALAGETRADAFRHAILALMDDETVPGSAHPGVWGPFALIGQ